MRIKTEFLASKEMSNSVGATWALADGDYTFSIISVRTSKGGNAMFATTVGYAMVGALIKNASAKAKEHLVDEQGFVSYDPSSLFTMSIKDKSIMRVQDVAPVAAVTKPAPATGKKK